MSISPILPLTSTRIKLIFSNLPQLTTPRLILRKIVPSDAADMYIYASDAAVTEFLPWNTHTSLMETQYYIADLQRRYADGNYYDWGIQFRENDCFIGTCGFTDISLAKNTAETGAVLSRSYWGRGIMAEAHMAIMRFGFNELNLDKIEARHYDGNDKSAVVMMKCGMEFDFTDIRKYKGEYKTMHTYVISREKFETLFTSPH